MLFQEEWPLVKNLLVLVRFACACVMSWLQGLRTEMEKYWPSWSQAEQCFWKHEWDKHGTCAAGTTGTQPLAYFAKTLTLHQEHDIAVSACPFCLITYT